MIGETEPLRLAMAAANPTGLRALLAADTCGQWVGVAFGFENALQLVREALPDVLVTDLALSGRDGVALIRGVRRSKLACYPAVIALTTPGMDLAERQAADEGVYAALPKSDAPALLGEALCRMSLEKRLRPAGVHEQYVREALWRLGFSPRLKGTAYLSAAVDLAVRDVRMRNRLTGELYPLIASRYGVSVERVQHAIRRVVEAAWSDGSSDAQYRVFGNTIDARRAKPTAGEMIACLAERLRAGLEMDT